MECRPLPMNTWQQAYHLLRFHFVRIVDNITDTVCIYKMEQTIDTSTFTKQPHHYLLSPEETVKEFFQKATTCTFWKNSRRPWDRTIRYHINSFADITFKRSSTIQYVPNLAECLEQIIAINKQRRFAVMTCCLHRPFAFKIVRYHFHRTLL